MKIVCICVAVISSVAAAANVAASPITATDFSGSSSLSGGVFSFQALLLVPLSGVTCYGDFNHDGYSDASLVVNYEAPTFGLFGPSFLLHLSPSNTTAYDSQGALTSTFDWAITGYEGFVSPGSPLPDILGSPLHGSATFESGKTTLHIDEGLLWGDGIFAGGWMGYKLNNITAITLTQGANGTFLLDTVVPVPGSICVLALLAFGPRRRRT